MISSLPLAGGTAMYRSRLVGLGKTVSEGREARGEGLVTEAPGAAYATASRSRPAFGSEEEPVESQTMRR
jgi:hypothetical protein